MTATTRVAACLVLPALLLAGCATEEPGDDPAARPPASETPSTVIPPASASGSPTAGDGTELPDEPVGSTPPAAGACLEGATECADMPDAGEQPVPPEGIEPTMVEVHDDLVDVRPQPWVEVTPNDDQTALTVSWWGGNEDCYGLAGVEVSETAEKVTITLSTGRVAGVDICTQEALYKATTVELDEALGNRSIIDGAA